MSALRTRVAGFNGRQLDVLLAAALTVELELETWLDPAVADSRRLLTGVAVVLVAAPVCCRRRRPGLALVVCAAAIAGQAQLGGGLSSLNGVSVLVALAVLAYGVGAWADAASGAIALLVAGALFSWFVFTSASGGIGAQLFALGLAYIAPWCAGRIVSDRTRRALAFRRLAERAATEQEERQRATIAQERSRIGRELQDIVAHSVSAMVIQAAGARRMLQSEPGRARDSMLLVETTGRDALADLRRLLGMLRKEDDPRALAPQPGLDQLTSLLQSISEEGLSGELRIDGTPIDLTPGLDLVGFRAVESMLACCARHGARRAVVTVHYLADQLVLEVRGDRSLPELDSELREMRERMALYDGSLEQLPSPGAGFALNARLPLRATVSR